MQHFPSGGAGAADSSRSYSVPGGRPAPQPDGTHEPNRSNSAVTFSSPPQWQTSPQQQHAPGPQQPIQYITIPEYQSAQGVPTPTPTLPTGPPLPTVQPSRKRRSRSPDDKEEDRLPQRPVSNVRGSEEDSEQELSSEEDEDRKSGEPSDYNLFPAHLLAEENKRNSFFNTVLGPAGPDSATPNGGGHSGSDKGRPTKRPRGPSSASAGAGAGNSANGALGNQSDPGFGVRPAKKAPKFEDPITAGLITEDEAKTLFELSVNLVSHKATIFILQYH